MDAQYTPLQIDPPAYSGPETASDHALLSSATEQNDARLAPGEMARQVHVDPIVRVKPLSYGFSYSYIELRLSVLQGNTFLIALISKCSWVLTAITLFIFDVSLAIIDQGSWSAGLAVVQACMICITVPMFAEMEPGLGTLISYFVQVMAQSALQLLFTWTVSAAYYSKCLVIFMVTALLGVFTLCANCWFFHCAGRAALDALAASQDGAAEEEESHALSNLGPSTAIDLPSEHKA